MKSSRLLAVMVVFLTLPRFAFGLRTETIGPVKGPFEQSDSGMIKILQHGTRVYSYEVSGSETFFFKATRREVIDLVKLFSQIHLRDHVVYARKESPEVKTFAQDKVDYNMSFHYSGELAIAMSSLTGNAEAQTYEPTLTIYFDPSEDRALAKMLQIAAPDNIAINSKIAGWSEKGMATVPKRSLWHAAVDFDDKKPAVDFENGLRTSVTLWSKDSDAGFNLGEVDYLGHVSAAFSEKEISDLKAGRTWLTLTVGNWLTAPKKDDPKISWDRLATELSKAKAVEVAKPRFYIGRLLFDDGSPAVFKPEIMITFPYAGNITIDKEGYFRVFFTPEQFKDMKARREEKNVYIPNSPNGSTALYAFPAAKLSLDKSTAGEVRIAKPQMSEKK